jgi:FkbM family methyltransferase
MLRSRIASHVRRGVLKGLRRLNVGDVTIRHHYTNDPVRLHFFKHRGYWYHGKRREQETMAAFARLLTAGDVVVEVGGHIGYMAVYFAHLVGPQGRVVVFEPGPNNLPYISVNARQYANIQVVPAALTDFTGNATLYTEELSGQNNSLLDRYAVLEANMREARLGEIQRGCVTVGCTTLDDFIQLNPLDMPVFVKIDVEGAELSVLRGMKHCLETGTVALMVEVTENHLAVFELLRDAGLSVFDAHGRQIQNASALPFNVFCLKDDDERLPALRRER